MGLGSALQIGRSALVANAAAIEVAGNNLANVGTEGYHRRTVTLTPVGTQEIQDGIFVGRGVKIASIVRNVDEALEQRVRNAVSDQAGSQARAEVLAQIESVQNELTDIDLSSRLSKFFNSWSELANRPEDLSLRSLVIQEGRNISEYFQTLRADMVDIRNQVDEAINQSAARVDDIMTRLANINQEVVVAERGDQGAHGLRDERDQLLEELSQYVDISTVEQPNGTVDVFIGSTPIILNAQSRGVEIKRQTVDGELEISLHLKEDGTKLEPTAGRLGAQIIARDGDVTAAIDILDDYTNQFIFEVNKAHSSGQALKGFDSVTGTTKFSDTSVALTDADSGLAFDPVHGSFQLHVTQKSTGAQHTSQIAVDLDGIGSDTSLQSLSAAINAVANVSSSITADGRLVINADSSDFEITFSDDSSGVLAASGINTFFAGDNAYDIEVNQIVDASPAMIAATQEHVVGGNANALAIDGLRDTGIEEFGGLSLSEQWRRHVEDYAVRLGQMNTSHDADTAVLDNLRSQRNAFSGVNVDEEAINLMAYQRAYQGSARFLSVIDEMMQTLLGIV